MTNSFFDSLIDDFDGGMDAKADAFAAHEKAHPFDDLPDLLIERAITPERADRQTFRETCKKCGGRGRFYGYSGRDFGACFACKGVGHFDRKTSPEARAHAKATTTARKERIVNETRNDFAANHPAEWTWMTTKGTATFTFPQAMVKAVEDFGGLTDRQMDTVQRLMARDVERDATHAAERATRDAAAPTVATDKLMAAFDAAVAKGIKRPKMRFEGFTASLAPASGKNPGAVYIKAAGDVYLGKIAAGRFMASREATEAQQADVVATMADPLAAAVAFGRRTGECSCCGRELTNALSIELGIGPICRERFGL